MTQIEETIGQLESIIQKENINTKSVNNILIYCVTTLLTIVITMAGFWLLLAKDFVTRQETIQMIQSENRTIVQQMEIDKKNNDKLKEALESTTNAMHELRLQIALLNKSIEDMKRNDRITSKVN